MHLPKTQKRKGLFAIFVVTIACVFLFIFPNLASLIIEPSANYLVKIATEIYKFVHWQTGAVNISADDLERYNSAILQLTIERTKLELTKEENDELRALLKFVQRTDIPYVAADIIAKSFGEDSTRLVINVGHDRGVAINDPVVALEGIIIGKVVSTTANSSTVARISNSEVLTAVGLINEHQTIGIAKGLQNGLLEISYIPLDEQVNINDIVITSGLEEGVPSGLIVGLINAIDIDETGLFQKAIVEPIIDARLLTEVFVLSDGI